LSVVIVPLQQEIARTPDIGVISCDGNPSHAMWCDLVVSDLSSRAPAA
jgi:hypothetical protein